MGAVVFDRFGDEAGQIFMIFFEVFSESRVLAIGPSQSQQGFVRITAEVLQPQPPLCHFGLHDLAVRAFGHIFGNSDAWISRVERKGRDLIFYETVKQDR